MAVGVYNGIAQAGLRIPDDISVTGFDNITMSEFLTPPLTTLHQCKYELGVGAAQMMLEMLKVDHIDNRQLPALNKVNIKGILCIRASTAAPRS